MQALSSKVFENLESIDSHFKSCFNFLDKKRENYLVHQKYTYVCKIFIYKRIQIAFVCTLFLMFICSQKQVFKEKLGSGTFESRRLLIFLIISFLLVA
jgi:hypothetical protein